MADRRWVDRVDFGKAAGDYARHRQGFPPELFDRLAGLGVGSPGQDLVDLGTGTGSLARGFAERGCTVVGVDPSAELLAQARELDAAAGVVVDHRVATAEQTGLPAGAVDVVTAGQCWHWFDRPAAAAEAMRVLRPGGRIALCYLDWIPLPGNVVEATEALILAHNPDWFGAGMTGMHPHFAADLSVAGFVGLESFSFDLDLVYSHEGWRGRIRASAGVGASLEPDRVEAFDAELAALLAERFPADPQPVHHRVWALVAHQPLDL